MNHEMFQMSEYELTLKKLYLSGNKPLVQAPMSFDAYKNLTLEYPVLEARGNYFAELTKGNLGLTMLEVEHLSKGDEIIIYINERYNYPLLHNHSYIEMIYVYSGSCTHFVEDMVFKLGTGDFCILAPNAMHALAIESDDSIVVNLLISRKAFNTSFLQLLRGDSLLIDFFENILFHKRVSPFVIYPTGDDPWIQHVIVSMLSEFDQKPYAYKESLELYTRHLFIHIIRNYGMLARISDTIENTQDNNILAILGYISINFTHLTLKELASFFNYSEAYISRLLKRYTGKTFGLIITELQMKYAKDLLDNSFLSMTEISQQVGCFDASHLTRKFKKIYGIPPNTYKKRVL